MNLLTKVLAPAAMMFLPLTALAQTDKTVTQYINPFIGSGAFDSKSLLGATYPGATTPFGMVQLSPDTKDAPTGHEPSGYDYSLDRIYGFTHTHLSGTGCESLCDILVMPVTQTLQQASETKEFDFSSHFSHQNEKATAGYYSVKLDDNGVLAELTATTRTGMHRYTFPKGANNVVLVDVNHSVTKWYGRHRIYDSGLHLVNDTTLEGFRIMDDWQRMRKVYFHAVFSRPVKHTLFMHKKLKFFDGDRTNGTNEHCFLEFEESDQPLIVKVAISPNSVENARLNMAENPGWDFDRVHQNAVAAWEKELSNIRVDGTYDQKCIFYTGLYHAYIQPNTISDINGEYMRTDYVTAMLPKGDTHYSTFSLWDTFRAAHPLYTLLKTDRVAGFVNSMIRQYDTYGYLPIWQLWGTENYCMIGNHAIPVMVDAALKKLPGVDAEKVYEAVKATSMREHQNWPCKTWDKYGYMPENLQTQSVSITLECSFDDACVARLAKALGKTADYEYFARRSRNYRNLFDSTTGFFRGKDDKGNWIEPFDPLTYGNNGGNPYTEGNAWQYLWYVPHDVPDLVKLLGGAKKFEQKLTQFFTLTTDNAGKDHNASGFIGQYAHGNEPSHHCAYLFDYVGKPQLTAYYANKVMNELYLNRVDGYSGNEDCGQMSSWYVFSSMGFYPTDPASGRYDFGSPQFRRVDITLPNGRTFVVKTNRKGADDYVIKKVVLNGKPLKTHYITHDQILAGGTLEFTMGKK